MTSKLDKVKQLERTRNDVVRVLTNAQLVMNLLSIEDELLRHTWQERGMTCSKWADEAEGHINAMIDVLLNG